MIDPVVFKIGFVQVSYYALVYILGFLAVLWILFSSRKKIDLKEREVYDLVFFLMVGVLIGARVFYVLFWGWDYYSANLGDLFHLWEGGLSFHGGLLGGVLVSWFYSWRKGVSFLRLADIVVLPVVFVLALGRIANFINQEIVGRVTGVAWCFDFRGREGCRHPVQLYASAGRFALFGFLFWVRERLGSFKEGLLFWLFIFWIGLGRFLMDFWKEGVGAGQGFGLLMFLVGGVVLWRRYWEDVGKLFYKMEVSV